MRPALVFFLLFGSLYDCANAMVNVNIDTKKSDSGEANSFVATSEWQEIQPGQAIPRGLHVRIDMTTGKREAKLLDPSENRSGGSVASIPVEKSEHPVDEARDARTFTHEELVEAMRKMPSGNDDSKSENSEHMAEIKNKFRSYEKLKEDLDSFKVKLKTDYEVLDGLVSEYEVLKKNEAGKHVRGIAAVLEEIEFHVHRFDTARDFASDGGFQRIVLPSLNSTDADVRAAAAFLAGSALQSNPKVQIAALEVGLIEALLRVIKQDESELVKKRAMYALSSLVRQFPEAQKRLISAGGLDVFSTAFEKNREDKVMQLKVITLLNDLVVEHNDALNNLNFSNAGHLEKLRQYENVNLLLAARKKGFCEFIPSLLELPEKDSRDRRQDLSSAISEAIPIRPEHDVIEKVLDAMKTFAPVCKEEFRKSSMDICKLLQNSYSNLADLESAAKVGSFKMVPNHILNLDEPRWDQSSYLGRAKHFFVTTNPLNVLRSSADLEKAKEIVSKYRFDLVENVFKRIIGISIGFFRAGTHLPGLSDDEIWRAKQLYDSAFHPDTGEKMLLIGRMSAQVPMNMLITGCMMTWYKSTGAVIFWQWANQSFNAAVNYTNRSGSSPIPVGQLASSYVLATSSALGTALGLNSLAKALPPLAGRWVPFAAVAAANCVNIPLMRRHELSAGIPVWDECNNQVGSSAVAAKQGIVSVLLSRILMASPTMIAIPLYMNHLEKKGVLKRRPWISLPLQILLCGLLLTFATPLCCAVFPQKASIAVSELEQSVQTSILLQELRLSLEKPLPERPALITPLLKRMSLRELCLAFPVVVENVFGASPDATMTTRCGWRLESYTDRLDPYGFRLLHDFLKPKGELMNFVSKLTAEASIKFPFPISRLPDGFKVQLKHGELSPFFAERFDQKGPVDPHPGLSLFLDPFEFLVFHLVAYAVNPEREGSMACPGYTDTITRMTQFNAGGRFLPLCSPPHSLTEACKGTLYMFLIDGYFEYFFSGDSDAAAMSTTVNVASSAQSPISRLPLMHQNSSATPRYLSPLIKASALIERSLMNGTDDGSSKISAKFDSAGTRRGQIMLEAVTHFWLALPPQFGGPSMCSKMDADMLAARNASPSSVVIEAPFILPSVELVTYARIVVKHVHFFLNGLPKTAQSQRQMENLRRQTIQTLRAALYPFLKQLFQRTPLDGTFRMILELWLSFIQPWRYVDLNSLEGGPRAGPQEIGEEWESFIAEHYVFYSVLFKAAIWRFARMELNSPRLSVCLFRAAKVFGTPNLRQILRMLDSEVGQALTYRKGLTTFQSPGGSQSTRYSAGVSNFSFDSHFRLASRMTNSGGKAVQSFIEFGGNDQEFLFSESTLTMVVELMRNIRSVQQNLDFQVRARSMHSNATASGDFLHEALESCSSFKSKFLYGVGSVRKAVSDLANSFASSDSHPSKAMANGVDESSPPNDPDKLMGSFDNAIKFLEEFFEVKSPPKLDLPENLQETLEESMLAGSSLLGSPMHRRTCKKIAGFEIDQTGVLKPAKIPIGNPDRLIPQSSEYAWIVLMLLDISDYINWNLGEKVVELYNNPSWRGRFARPFIRDPQSYDECQKLGFGQLKTTRKILPPRICLRRLGKRWVVNLACFVFVLRMFGLCPLDTAEILAVLIIITILYSLKGAFFDKTPEPFRSSAPDVGFRDE
ncbi:unnamed protein product [Notodromas monacha]|uniref:Uncharacterized protein n=1 Tax=Notodromas monacha TaxID=399045 RepID=A0A7R9G9M7_9CRUS|nr:unnamed protein product [Notodromas monacha]CAG0913381.1 unnamed protein product [Notodromas monacha]